MSTDYTATLRAVTDAADTYAQALRCLKALADDDGVSLGWDLEETAATVIRAAGSITKNTERRVAESRRPKGSSVRVIISSRFGGDSKIADVELIRTTSAQAFVRFASGAVEAYKIESGYRVKSGSTFSDTYRIHPDDLATARAMKAGHNDVSKALDAIEKGR